jgi:hypothetical protein
MATSKQEAGQYNQWHMHRFYISESLEVTKLHANNVEHIMFALFIPVMLSPNIFLTTE